MTNAHALKCEGKRDRAECYDCTRPAAKGKRRCPGHLRQNLNDRKDVQQGRRDRGQCGGCGAPPESGYTRCRLCRLAKSTVDQTTRAARRAQGLCKCGRKPLKGSADCRKCKLTRTKAG